MRRKAEASMMDRWWSVAMAVSLAGLFGGVGLVACTATAKGKPPVAQPEASQTSAPDSAPGSAPDPTRVCDAGSLPRLDESQVKGGKKALVAAAAHGAVVVTWDGHAAAVVEDCRLPSGYLPLGSRVGAGTFYAIGRVFFRPDEIPDTCHTATHLVAALATWDEHASAILVPLPCPSVTDEKPAVGCVGRNKTGRQRAAAATRLITSPPLSEGGSDPGARLAAWALAPDTSLGLRPLFNGQGDDLSRQSHWLVAQYDFSGVSETTAAAALRPAERSPRSTPKFSYADALEIAPLFRDCFLPQVDPKFTSAVTF